MFFFTCVPETSWKGWKADVSVLPSVSIQLCQSPSLKQAGNTAPASILNGTLSNSSIHWQNKQEVQQQKKGNIFAHCSTFKQRRASILLYSSSCVCVKEDEEVKFSVSTMDCAASKDGNVSLPVQLHVIQAAVIKSTCWHEWQNHHCLP